MKNVYLIGIVSLICGIGVGAQPVLEAGDLPTDYSANAYVMTNTQSFSPGTAGANKVWDFSSAQLQDMDGTFSVVPVQTSPEANSFPTATYCIKTTSSSDAFPSYFFYKLSSTAFELTGFVNVNDIEHNDVVVFSNPKTVLQFPYTYNTVINDQYAIGNESVSFTATYDAYGTLILPFATYYNVIRQKRTEFGYDFYTFFRTNPFGIVLEGNFTPLAQIVVYEDVTGLGVNEKNKEALILVYPNPTSSVLNLQLLNENKIDNVVVTDLTGKIVLEQSQVTNEIDVQHLASGMYFLTLFSNTEKYQSKFVKE